MNEMFVPGPHINVDQMRKQAKLRAERDNKKTLIHLHAYSSKGLTCDADDEYHEVYGDG